MIDQDLIFADRIEFESPGGLLGPEKIDDARQGRTHWRNPVLARFLQESGLVQEAGTGLPKAIRETLALAGSEPRFDVDTWFRVTVPAYYPSPDPASQSLPPDPADGILLISIGHGTIDPDLVRRSNPVFRQMPTERFRTFHHGVLLEGDRWSVLIREFRNWIRDCMEESEFPEFHLFYRGPVAIGPLIGAMAVGRKPLNVYFLDEDSGLYRQAYRLDRRLLQEP